MNIHIWALALLCLTLGPYKFTSGQQQPAENKQLPKSSRSILGSQGIVVPKRSSFIHGLNEQFKPKLSILSDSKNASLLTSTQTPVTVSDNPSGSSSFLASHLPTFLLGSRGFAFKKQQQQQQQQQQSIEQQTLTNLQDKQSLYLDRHQQQMLAANPNLTIITPSQIRATYQQQQQHQTSAANGLDTSSNGIATLLPPVNLAPGSSLLAPDFGTHSQIQKSLIQSIPLGEPFKYQNTQAPQLNSSSILISNSQTQSLSGQKSIQNQQVDPQQQVSQQSQYPAQSHLYRGYSLIELDIKSESERRYMKDLYANLSTVINEQASNPNTSPQVSPYVDVDFWSFGRASLNNDQIDVMVSPRSKPFLLAQLAKAKIRHRVKIEDIQARIDRDQASHGQIDDLPLMSNAGLGLFSSLPVMNPFSYSNTNSLQTNNYKSQESNLLGRQSNDIISSGSGSTNPNGGTITNPTSNNGGNQPLKLVNESAFFDNYQRLQIINQYLEYIVQRDGDVAQVKVIGRSSQGRHLRVLKLGYEKMDGDQWDTRLNSPAADVEPSGAGARAAMTQQPLNGTHIMNNFFARQNSVEKLGSIWLDGGTHAREWISVSTVLYLAFRLSDNHNRCGKFFTTLKSMVNDYEQSLASHHQSNHHHSNHHQSATSSSNVAMAASAATNAAINQFEASLFNGLNELNAHLSLAQKFAPSSSSIHHQTVGLSGKQANPTSGSGGQSSNLRPRNEMEQMLDLISKNPQIVASEYGCDLELDQLLRRYTFFIMPVLNPDGYEYSHTHNRLWRKTRSTSNHPIYRHFCLGADPNRNYDAHHGSTGSSSHPCSQTFAGSTPFTEPETRHQSNFVYANRFGMKMYISFHSYSQMILLPLSHSKGTIPDLKDLESVGNAAAKAIEATHGTQYRVGQSAAILYTAAGTASDWAYEKANVKYSYTIELRDTGSYGFLLPRQQIIPTGEETFNGLLAMIAQMEKNDNLLTSKSTTQLGIRHNQASIDKATGQLTPALIDYNRASQSDLDRLNSFMNNKRRAQLESVHSNAASGTASGLDSPQLVGDFATNSITSDVISDPSASGNAQATAEPSLLGVRDRRPGGGISASEELPNSSSSNEMSPVSSDEDSSQNGFAEPSSDGSGSIAMSPMDPLGQPISVDQPHDHDGESGYAFEGEGELMEPAAEGALNGNSIANENYLTEISGARAHVAESKLTSRRLDTVKRIGEMTKLGGNGRNSINSPPPTKREPAQQARRESSNNQLLSMSLKKSKKLISS